ncbi:MAM and LDL-receptor class A domain-containing 2-like, partial [Paramuricea clavata]
MWGDHIGNLSVKVRDTIGGPETTLWIRNGQVGNYWARAEVILQSPKDFQIIIEAVRGTNYQGDISIDDVSLTPYCKRGSTLPTAPPTSPQPTTPGPCGSGRFQCKQSQTCISNSQICDYWKDCPDGSDEAKCGSCTFESADLCGWKDVSTGEYGWLRNRGTTPSHKTGPKVDHTCGTSSCHYIYIEDGSGTSYQVANIESPPTGKTYHTCTVQFYYHLYGTFSSANYLWIGLTYGGSTSYIWNTNGDQGDKWNKGEFGLGSVPAGTKISFEALKPWTFFGAADMAIDDVSFVNCGIPKPRNCLPGEFKCKRQFCVAPDRICDFADDCGDQSDETTSACLSYPGRCNFEKDTCFWTQDTGDDFDWTRAYGYTWSYKTGPGRDHTTSTPQGYYLYIETSYPRTSGEVARISSPIIKVKSAQDNCRLRMFYHMFGKDVNSLKIYHRDAVGGKLSEIKTILGDQGDVWRRYESTSLFKPTPFQIVIEATVGASYQGDIAIDDLSFTPGCIIESSTTLVPTGFTVPTSITCQVGQMSCDDGQCIAANKYCNFRKDCTDGSDEKNCAAKCDFETNECGWRDNKYKDHIDFTRDTGGTPTPHTGPSVDHTLGTSLGHYVYAAVNNKTGGFAFPRYISPRYYKSSKTCKFRFYYHMNGSSYALLSVNIWRNNLDTYLWSDTFKLSNEWRNATVDLPPCLTDFQ